MSNIGIGKASGANQIVIHAIKSIKYLVIRIKISSF